MGAVVFGIVLVGAAVLGAWLSGGSPSDGPWLVLALVGGWLIFTPVRRAIARGERRPDPPRP